jgi:hypothetical protein
MPMTGTIKAHDLLLYAHSIVYLLTHGKYTQFHLFPLQRLVIQGNMLSRLVESIKWSFGTVGMAAMEEPLGPAITYMVMHSHMQSNEYFENLFPVFSIYQNITPLGRTYAIDATTFQTKFMPKLKLNAILCQI